jgi:NAD(P)-dependent dehydrogenase (short-subunit alcohol dehydrogenase family)
VAQNVFITGTNIGLGRLTALGLLEAGHSVVGSMRDINGRNSEAASELRAAGAHVVDIDVTDDSSVEAGIADAVAFAGSLDVVINNAGVGSSGVLEAFTSEDWQASFDINVFGMQRVTRAALPFMRTQGSGLLVFVSSVVGRIAFPFFGPYNAAKFAVEGLAETCRADLSSLGIQTCVVEPGPFPTNFIHGLMPASDTTLDDDYADMLSVRQTMLEGFQAAWAANPGQDPQIVADAIVALLGMPASERPFRTVVDNMGMADAVAPLNQGSDAVTQGLYGAFGMAEMLTVRSGQ